MHDALTIWNRFDEIFTEITIYKEFKTGHRSLFGLDGIALLLMTLGTAVGLTLILFGLVGSKLALPALLMYLCGYMFLFGDQFLSPTEARVLGAEAYRTGWSPGYVWFVSLAFAMLGLLLTYFWSEIPARISDTEPINGIAVFSPRLPPSAKVFLAKTGQSKDSSNREGTTPKTARAKH